jgi:hypothetical protein
VSDAYAVGDEVMFFDVRYRLVQRAGPYGWIAVAVGGEEQKPRIILEEYFRPVPA